ncbi:hypothetical protein MMPV_005205 [Pyropia vietnamensis]
MSCRLHPTTPGGVSPDPDAVTDPYGRGGTGWVLRANASASDVVIPYGAGTCATPLDDAVQLEFLAAPDEMSKELFWTVDTNLTTDGEADAEFDWAGFGIEARLNFVALRTDTGSDGVSSAVYYRPHPCGSAGEHIGLVCADEVARMLTVHRNQQVGLVQRHRGLFDVLSVSRVTNGVVLDRHGLVVAAQDRVSDAAGYDGVAVVMYTTRDNHTRPVLIGEAALLSLGRALMVDPSWLGASFPGGINSSVEQGVYLHETGQRLAAWSLHHDSKVTNSSSSWLADVAFVLCLLPSASFVVDPSVCDGVEQPKPSGRASLQAGGRPVADSLGVGLAQHPEAPEVATEWNFYLPEQLMSARACPLFDSISEYFLEQRQPIWLLGRGSRELHTTGPAGETEVTLARRLSSCAFNGTRWDLYSSPPFTRGISDLTVELSQRYRRDLFRVDPPVDPISNAGLILAVLVVLPEAVAVMLLLLQRRGPPHRQYRWRWRNGLALTLVVMAGAIALVGVGYLDYQEHDGHAWRAATVRTGTLINVNGTEQKYVAPTVIDYRGRLTWHTESLIIVARTGYRPHITRRLLVVCVVAYAMLTAAVLTQGLVVEWLWRRSPDGDNESSAVDGFSAPPRDGPRWRARSAAPRAAGVGDPLAHVDRCGRGSGRVHSDGHGSLAG